MATITLSAANARALLRFLSFDEFFRLLRSQSPFEPEEACVMILYTNYLVARGVEDEVRAFLDAQSVERQHELVNTPDMGVWDGNTLHSCAYWLTGDAAISMYRLLLERGATPRKDYYDDYPWEVKGQLWISPLGHVTPLERDQREFLDTHYALFQLYGNMVPDALPPGPPRFRNPDFSDPLIENCPLHNSRSMYTRNSQGRYSMYAPPCNGCTIGREEEAEYWRLEA